MKVKEALKITDSFTKTSKMPGLSYSLPAWACQTGSKLRLVKTSPCYGCYALKGNYTRYPAIREAQYRRLDAINHPLWVEAMATKIKNQKWFRWHDAGDVQSKEHMAKIIEICKLTPDTKHWPPCLGAGQLGLPSVTTVDECVQALPAVPSTLAADSLIIKFSGTSSGAGRY